MFILCFLKKEIVTYRGMTKGRLRDAALDERYSNTRSGR